MISSESAPEPDEPTVTDLFGAPDRPYPILGFTSNQGHTTMATKTNYPDDGAMSGSLPPNWPTPAAAVGAQSNDGLMVTQSGGDRRDGGGLVGPDGRPGNTGGPSTIGHSSVRRQ
jgi:hypothetical protein